MQGCGRWLEAGVGQDLREVSRAILVKVLLVHN